MVKIRRVASSFKYFGVWPSGQESLIISLQRIAASAQSVTEHADQLWVINIAANVLVFQTR